jgi:hypothetical protein
VFGALTRGIAAGAAGTTALNAATYLDMAVRGRGSSNTPAVTVDTLAERSGHPVPGEGEERQNRLEGLGALSGILTGVGVGAATGLFAPLLTRLPLVLSAALVGGGAMAASDLSMTRLGVTDPTSWSAADWASDALPHLAYGAMTVAVLRGFRSQRRKHAPTLSITPASP